MAQDVLQVLTTLDAPSAPAEFYMEPELALDVGDYGHVVLEVRVPNAGPSGSTLTLQTAPHRSEESFYDVPGVASVGLSAVGAIYLDLGAQHARFLRWRANTPGIGTLTFQIDAISRHPGALFNPRLQEPTTVNAVAIQRLQEALDIGPYGRILAVFRVLEAATTGTIRLQHAAVLDEEAFQDATGSASITSVGTVVVEYTNLLRYVRWKIDGTFTGPCKFSVDLICRER